MKYSVIICYRDREEHLSILLPQLKRVFKEDAEIIVVEQNDDEPFMRGNCFNAGAQIAKGDILIFHDVDHYPIDDNVRYDPPDNVDVWLPIERVEYVDTMDSGVRFLILPEEQIPSGYRHFKDGVDDNFFGGISVFRREAFFKINGFNSLYRGWGLEDADLRERISHTGLTVERGSGNFYALQHKDSNPGVQDQNFVRNQQLFARWKEYLVAGVNTQFQTMSELPYSLEEVDTWVRVNNFMTVSEEGTSFMTVDNIAEYYEDTEEKHEIIWKTFKMLVNDHPMLKPHRDWIVQNDWGYGNRAFHWMWYIISKDLPYAFKFLEIGVFKGQVISLMSLLNKLHKKEGRIFGITPLDNAGDKYSKHPDVDYEEHIMKIYQQFGLDAEDLNIIQGLSNDPEIIETTQEQGPYDVVFVDGCHDYEVVVSDIMNYGEMLVPGGLMVIDDVSNYLNIPDGLIRMDWRGLEDVSNAARDTIEKDNRFEELFAVGHNRIWRKHG